MTYYETQAKELRRSATCVYLACEESVAADISDKLSRAADSIELLVQQGTTLKAIAEDDPSGKWGRWAREALIKVSSG